MTPAQWLFHYHETVAEENKQTIYEVSVVKALIDTLSNVSDKLSAYTNPRLYLKLNAEAQKQQMFDQGEESWDLNAAAKTPTKEEQEIQDKYNDFLSAFPAELEVERNTQNKLLPQITKEDLYKKNALGINRPIHDGG